MYGSSRRHYSHADYEPLWATLQDIGRPGYLQWVEAANSYLQDRLLFGSAFPVLGVKQTVEGYQKLPYKAGVLEKVLYKNAARLLRMSV